MSKDSSINLRYPARLGLIAGFISLSISMIGLVVLFGKRELIADILTMGQILIVAPTVVLAFRAAQNVPNDRQWQSVVFGLLIGLISGIPLVLLIGLGSAVNLREYFPNVSPALFELITLGQPPGTGSLLLLGVLTAVGLITAAISNLPRSILRPIFWGLLFALTVGLFSEILSNRIRDFYGSDVVKVIFSGRALKPVSALVLFTLVAGSAGLWQWRGDWVRQGLASLPAAQRKWLIIAAALLGVLFLIALPRLLGPYLSEVINNVGIFILMGLGLNIVVGFAGLLDLGYVAFFAIGAYTMAVLTSEGDLGLAGLNFWAALPFCIVIAAFAGIVLGVPVLRMRGDYLAIVTLGFGEIIRILALSDLLKPIIGGAQGVLKIPKPSFGQTALIKPEVFYYVVLAGCLLAWFVSWRLSESRLGRQWMALREDEDVAEAMGIKLVSIKLLAFAIGAAFSGLAGAIFASKLTSIFPHSFKLETSINVLSLIIIGGMGSLPGVVVGSLILVGLPELLREFAEYRPLMYGLLLVVMMLAKPEGFWPSVTRRRELHTSAEELQLASTATSGD